MPNLVSDTINFMVPFCRYQEANIGTNNMPMIGIVNIVQNIILAAPFTWRFNRNSVNLVGSAGSPPAGVVKGVQDYTQNVPDFGFLERSTASGPDGNGGRRMGTDRYEEQRGPEHRQ